VNQTIKKYNLALSYCQKDSRDLAILQLKKVLSLNSKLVKAHQLLALLYIQDGKYDLAKKTLRAAGKIDSNNTVTLRYLKETNARLREKSPSKKTTDEDLISYQSGNETIIMPKRFKESSLGASIVYIVIGLIVGAAVTAWLIVPNVKNSAKEDAQKQIVEASDAIATDSQTIKDLEAQVDELQSQLTEASNSNDEVQSQITSYERLLQAYSAYYKDGDAATAGKKLDKVVKDDLSKSAKKIYNSLNTVVLESNFVQLYQEGYSAYQSSKYEEAIEALQQIVDVDEDYNDGSAAYYLAQSYRKNGDLESAKPYYKYVVENHPNTEKAKTSRYYVD
jgi:TolA-binding protein